MTHESLAWNGEVRHLLAHANGEEWLLMEALDERRVQACWITDAGRESLIAMGWRKIDRDLPQSMRAMAERLLAEDREPPSAILSGLVAGMKA